MLPMPNGVEITPNQIIPFWSGFNHHLCRKRPSYTPVSYAPIIDAKPADMATVYTTMRRCKDMCAALGQRHAVQTMDQQLYAIAQQVKWALPDELGGNVLRMGGFHTLSCFIACVGKFWGDSGLLHFLVDSGVYAASTADQMLAGKQFNRALRGLTLAYETLTAMKLAAFVAWCERSGGSHVVSPVVWRKLADAQQTYISESKQQTIMQEVCDVITQHLLPKLHEFQRWGYVKSPTFQFWDQLLEALQILLLNVRAEREGDWGLHLQTQRAMVPYFFAADRQNYARWTPVYILDMLNLPQEVQSAFEAGEFAVRQIPGCFNGIWSDMGTEKTVIRDAKGSSGIVGLTRKKPALIRRTLTRHIMSEYTKAMRERSGLSTSAEYKGHKEVLTSTLKRDEEHVRALTKHAINNKTNPFEPESHPHVLINLSTGLHATQDVQNSLLNIVDAGEKRLQRFVHGTLESGESYSFYSPINKSGMKTFADMAKKTKFKCGKGGVVTAAISPEIVFRRALSFARCRDDVSMATVLGHPIGPVPMAIFHPDGTMRKTNKAELGHQLEAQVERISELPQSTTTTTVYIRDAMAVFQMMAGDQFNSFDALALSYFKQLLMGFQKADTVVEVFDRYDDDNSVKTAEQERRAGSTTACKQYQVIGGRPVPPWKRFLDVPSNKQSLQNFLCEYVVSHASHWLETHTTCTLLVVGGFADGEVVKSISSRSMTKERRFASTQEEADTRMLLHAGFADADFAERGVQGTVVIRSPDTDVLVLAVYYFPKMANTVKMWLETGTITSTTDKRRCVPVHSICAAVGPQFCNVLPAMHSLTGCDSVSSLFGIGKKTVFNIVMQKGVDHFMALTTLGTSNKEAALSAARAFTAMLYDPKGTEKNAHSNLNRLRLKLVNKKDRSLAKLPPCEASFKEHARRAQWQTKVWMSSYVTKPNIASPLEHGWERKNGKLVPVYFKGPMASELLEGLICSCTSRSRCINNCSCSQNSLCCTELCTCHGNENCGNPHSVSDLDILRDDDEDDGPL